MMESVYCDFTKFPGDVGKRDLIHFFVIILLFQVFDAYKFILQFLKKISRNGSDTPTSNQRQFISTSSGIQLSLKETPQFRSIWRW